MTSQLLVPPLKSVAGALLFSVLLGPIGLLYSSFWGGFLMIFVTLVVIKNLFFIPILLSWVICCIWSVGAAESYNRRVLKALAAENVKQ